MICTVSLFSAVSGSGCAWSKSHSDSFSHLLGLHEKAFCSAFHLWQVEQGISLLSLMAIKITWAKTGFIPYELQIQSEYAGSSFDSVAIFPLYPTFFGGALSCFFWIQATIQFFSQV
jgi:hypothetical protein